MGGGPGSRDPADRLLYPADHGEAQGGQVYIRHDRDGGVAEFLCYHLAGAHSRRARDDHGWACHWGYECGSKLGLIRIHVDSANHGV